MKTFRFTAVAAFAVVALSLAGCFRQGTNSITYKRGQEGPVNVELDGKLAKLAKIVDVNEFDRGGVLNVQVDLENTTGRDQNVLVQWTWYEGEYKLPEGTGIQRSVNLEARQVETIGGVAPNGNVDGWQLNVYRAEGD